jgi:SAM-dependent methyltransferase
LRYHAGYFNDVEGKRVASVFGSDGRRALALALLKAEATVFDISEPQKKYALELAEAAGVKISYEINDFCDTDLKKYDEYFDYAYAEGGILHFFHDLNKFFSVLYKILKPNGTLVLCDFHPFSRLASSNKILTKTEEEETTEIDYFDNSVQKADVAYKQYFPESEHDSFPDTLVRRYTLSDIINSVIQAGFNLREFNEHTGWVNKKRPGEFTIIATKI